MKNTKITGERCSPLHINSVFMCVGLSAKVVSVNEGTAVIDASGAKREVSADLIDDLEVGDYVMVHAGVAIAKITSDDSEETDEIMESIQ